MMASQKHPAKLKVTIIALVGLLVFVGLGVFVLLQNDKKVLADEAMSRSTGQDKPVESVFSFTGSGGWRQGPTNETSMALFSSESPDGTSACFTSSEYHKGTIDLAALQKNHDMMAAGGYTVTSLGTQTLKLKTSDGEKQYELHQTKVTTPSGTMQVMGGNELGYIQLSEGYIRILGNCNSADELPITLPALSAVKYTGKL